MPNTAVSERLEIRRWEPYDAEAALAVYASPSVTPWLGPDLREAPTCEGMRARIQAWRDEDHARGEAAGHWAVRTRGAGDVVGALALHYVPVGGANLTLSWALAPHAWGHGYAAEAGSALIRWAVHEVGALEVFAILPPGNERAIATARRMGMEQATELGGHRYVVFRIRHSDLGGPD
ncbi:GNAT family N-acetyltransferase [Nocardioides halotolerans]|uniref:GNAT family N-acetyltransferase n=1 Tax=Nocardioides halotolerans TaxID=433660 RepID=UPI00048AEACD|nr:GNAT family N-acetyltransferase [Nocardioides halotolerans]